LPDGIKGASVEGFVVAVVLAAGRLVRSDSLCGLAEDVAASDASAAPKTLIIRDVGASENDGCG